MVEYYILSTKCSIQERKTKKNGIVYDVVFRVITTDGREVQKRLSGYRTKKAAREAHVRFVTEKCTVAESNPAKAITEQREEDDPTVASLLPQYILSLNNQNKDSSIYTKIRVYDAYILPMLGQCRIRELTRERLYRWQDAMWALGNPKTKKSYSSAYLERCVGISARSCRGARAGTAIPTTSGRSQSLKSASAEPRCRSGRGRNLSVSSPL